MPEEATFGSWLRERRKALDLTQEELARRVSCSLVLIQKIEANERRPSKQLAGLLAAHLNVPEDECANFVRFARFKNARFPPNEKSPWRAWRQRQTNLPVPPTPVFGRAQETAAIVRRIAHDHVRLLTLVGPPGIGKTRLALACADELLGYFDDGVYFVALAPVREPDLVAPAIARALGVTDIAGRSILHALTRHLASRRTLILLDNFEQVVAAAPLVAELLAACPWLYLLVTSRVSLHVRAERQFRVPPLALPATDEPQQCLESPAMQFFIDRVRSMKPEYAPAPEEVPALVQICARLDGLPLAIELVAPHMNKVSPRELLAQIEQRLALLTGGPYDLPARHQSLRNAMNWSYDLLEARERALFAQLAVFVDGCTVEAAQQVCGDAELLAQLAGKSLLMLEDQRYAMLETIREYALERLEESEASKETRSRHLSYFLHLAEGAEPELTKPQQMVWLDCLEREHHNLRAALRWALEMGEAEKLLRLTGALWRFWQTRGYLSEGLEWLQTALNLEPTRSDVALAATRAKALTGAGWLLRDFGDFAGMKNCFEECLAICEHLEDKSQLAFALYSVGYANFLIGDLKGSIQTIEESISLYRALSNEDSAALPLFMLGRIATSQGDYEHAQRCLMASFEIERKRGAPFGAARTLGSLGELAIYRGEYARAETCLEQSQSILNELGERQLSTWVLTKRGELAWRQGDLVQARSFLDAGLRLSQEIGYRWNTAYALTYLGLVALSEGDLQRAESLCEDSLALFRELESEQDFAQTQKDLARVLLQRGACMQSMALYKECLDVLARRQCLPDIAECFEGLATLRCSQGDPIRAIRLFGAAEALRERIGAPMPPVLRASYERSVASLCAQLDGRTFTDNWVKGRGLTLEQALANIYATANSSS